MYIFNGSLYINLWVLKLSLPCMHSQWSGRFYIFTTLDDRYYWWNVKVFHEKFYIAFLSKKRYKSCKRRAARGMFVSCHQIEQHGVRWISLYYNLLHRVHVNIFSCVKEHSKSDRNVNKRGKVRYVIICIFVNCSKWLWILVKSKLK